MAFFSPFSEQSMAKTVTPDLQQTPDLSSPEDYSPLFGDVQNYSQSKFLSTEGKHKKSSSFDIGSALKNPQVTHKRASSDSIFYSFCPSNLEDLFDDFKKTQGDKVHSTVALKNPQGTHTKSSSDSSSSADRPLTFREILDDYEKVKDEVNLDELDIISSDYAENPLGTHTKSSSDSSSSADRPLTFREILDDYEKVKDEVNLDELDIISSDYAEKTEDDVQLLDAREPVSRSNRRNDTFKKTELLLQTVLILRRGMFEADDDLTRLKEQRDVFFKLSMMLIQDIDDVSANQDLNQGVVIKDLLRLVFSLGQEALGKGGESGTLLQIKDIEELIAFYEKYGKISHVKQAEAMREEWRAYTENV